MGGACGGVCGITGNLSYDGSKLELMAASGLQGFDFTQGTSIVLYKNTGASNGGVLSLRFRNRSLSSGESTTISVTGISVTNGDEEVGLGSTSKTIQYLAPQQENQPSSNENSSSSDLAVPSTSTRSTREANENQKSEENQEPKESQEENITEPEKSSNAYLKTLTINIDGLDFDKDILSYDIAVGRKVSEITVGASAEDEKSTINGLGKYSLSYGLNEYKITVKAEDGSEKEYVIKIYRDGANEAIAEYENTISGLNVAIVLLSAILAVGVITAATIFIRPKLKKNKSTNSQTNTHASPENHPETPNPFSGENNNN